MLTVVYINKMNRMRIVLTTNGELMYAQAEDKTMRTPWYTITYCVSRDEMNDFMLMCVGDWESVPITTI